jgi:DNA-binding NtrC family response regulator
VKRNLLEGKRVLIVDDEPDVLETLEESLTMCQVSKASSFNQAKELLETQHFDFAILDIVGVDGYKLLKIAYAKNVTPVMLTANALSPENILKSHEGGAASYVPKARMSEIEGVLNDILHARAEGKDPWHRWWERFGSYFKQHFGFTWDIETEAWKENQVMKWEKYFNF